MNTCYVVRSSRPAGLFSFGLLDGLHVRLRRPYLREVPAGFGLERLATAFMNNPSLRRFIPDLPERIPYEYVSRLRWSEGPRCTFKNRWTLSYTVLFREHAPQSSFSSLSPG